MRDLPRRRHAPGVHGVRPVPRLGAHQGLHTNIGYDAPKGMEETRQAALGTGEDPAHHHRRDAELHLGERQHQYDADAGRGGEPAEGRTARGHAGRRGARSTGSTARAEDEARGVFWPMVDPPHTAQAGTAWQVFPNFQIGHAVNNMLCYQARPFERRPGQVHLRGRGLRAVPGGRSARDRVEITEDEPDWPPVLQQDFTNMAAVQRGHEEPRLPRTQAQPLHGALGRQPALQSGEVHGHGRADPARLSSEQFPHPPDDRITDDRITERRPEPGLRMQNCAPTDTPEVDHDAEREVPRRAGQASSPGGPEAVPGGRGRVRGVLRDRSVHPGSCRATH